MSFLLSTGKVTTNKIEYIKDCIRLEMSLIYRDIPYFNGGIDIIDDSIVTSNVEASIRAAIESMLKRVASSLKGVSLNVENIAFNPNSINIEVKINGISSYYEIQRGNQE